MFRRVLLTVLAVSAAFASVVYTYDGAGRLMKADYGTAGAVVYTYDSAGHLISRLVQGVAVPLLTVTKTHTGAFTQGQTNATYTVTVSNGTTAAPTSGTVTVTETAPGGLTLVSMAGTGWTCPLGGTTCTRNDVLNPGTSYGAITVLVNVSPTASSPQTNQVTVSGGGAASTSISDSTTITPTSPLGCVANAASVPQLRPESYSELLGDVVITCTGGTSYPPGSPIPSVNVWLNIAPNVNVTSRQLGTSAGLRLTDALLLIDDPGSSQPTGAVGPYGPHAPQSLCGAVPFGCPAYAGLDSSGSYAVAVTAPGSTINANNVYQGALNAAAANMVVFYLVPVLPPTLNGAIRTFRVTNVRIPTVGMAPGQIVSILFSTSPSTVLPVQSENIPVGVVGPPMAAVVAQSTGPFVQSKPPGGAALSARITYTEGFATMFKTRVVPLSNTMYAAEAKNNSGVLTQNIPGGLYGGFASNSESGFILPALVGGSSGQFTAGLADFGTRLKAVFTNIPAGITIYVSTTSTTSGYPSPGGTGTAPYAVLVAGNSGEAAPDGTTFAPLTSSVTGSDGFAAFPLTPNGSGVASAVWEVVNANPSGTDALNFSVYINYTGIPASTVQTGAPANNVALSFAPEPGGGAFTLSAATSPETNIVPRFGVVNLYGGSWVSIVSSILSIGKTHAGNFTQGQLGATYTLTVSNGATAGPTSGTVTVAETVPAGLMLVSMGGTGWTCGGNTCTRNDALNPGSSYPAITATVNVATNASSPQINQASATGGGSATATVSDSTIVSATDGTLTVGSGSVPPGGTFSIPVTLALNAPKAANNITFAVQVLPNGNSPALTGSLGFTNAISSAPLVSSGGTSNSISVVWSSLSPAVSGTQLLGNITGSLPSESVSGNTYAVHVTGAGASLSNTAYIVTPGPSSTLTVVQNNYLVGDVSPYTSDTSPNFGDTALNILDLVQVLFAVNSVPGFTPAHCSDRFDAMDLYPADTSSTRGGDGVLDIRDLVLELFRVNNLDLNRPVRPSRGGSCGGGSIPLAVNRTATFAMSRLQGAPELRLRAGTDGALLFGAPQKAPAGQERIPVYLEARRDLKRVAITFAAGDQHSRLQFAAEISPSLAEDGKVGVVALAWLNGLSVEAGHRVLLGYVVGPIGISSSLKLYGVSAVGLEDNLEVLLNTSNAAGANWIIP